MRRSMPGAGALAVVTSLLAVALLAAAGGAAAATLTPTTTVDQFDLVADAECSLREAVESANLNADFGGCVAAGVYGDDVIELAAATYVLDVGPAEPSFDFDNSVGDLDVTPDGVERLDVLGQGAAVTVVERAAMADPSRIFDVDFLALVRLADLTVRNGLDDELGGGIYGGGFELTLERVVVRDNTVSGLAGLRPVVEYLRVDEDQHLLPLVVVAAAWTGPVAAQISIEHVTITGNTATVGGGGVWFVDGRGEATDATAACRRGLPGRAAGPGRHPGRPSSRTR